MNSLVAPLAAVAVLALFAAPRKASASPPQAPNPKPQDDPAPGQREYTHPTPPGYTRKVGTLPPEAGAFASQGLSRPYGSEIGPSVLSDGRTYIAATESHFDDHTVNPKTGVKDKHWHKGVSLFVKLG
jgi:hypothetical protein